MAAPAALVPQVVPANGATALALTWTAGSTDGFTVDNTSGKVLVLVKNTDSSPHTVVVASIADEYGCTGDLTITCGATTGFSVAGPFAKNLFPASLALTIATATGMSVAAIIDG
jgi:hypothetical protein